MRLQHPDFYLSAISIYNRLEVEKELMRKRYWSQILADTIVLCRNITTIRLLIVRNRITWERVKRVEGLT